MSRVEPLKKTDVKDSEVKEVYRNIENQFGFIPNIFGTVAKHTEALKPMTELIDAITNKSNISSDLQEIANLETSRINKCHYCLTHHSELARQAGVSKKKIEALNKGSSCDEFNEIECALRAYALNVTLDAENVSEEIYNSLNKHFSENEFVNLTLIIGMMNLMNKFNGALDVDLEK